MIRNSWLPLYIIASSNHFTKHFDSIIAISGVTNVIVKRRIVTYLDTKAFLCIICSRIPLTFPEKVKGCSNLCRTSGFNVAEDG